MITSSLGNPDQSSWHLKLTITSPFDKQGPHSPDLPEYRGYTHGLMCCVANWPYDFVQNHFKSFPFSSLLFLPENELTIVFCKFRCKILRRCRSVSMCCILGRRSLHFILICHAWCIQASQSMPGLLRYTGFISWFHFPPYARWPQGTWGSRVAYCLGGQIPALWVSGRGLIPGSL
jgi:hypothetical protein